MVDRILDAGTRVLIADGYENASTNRVAKEAGVSPGSVYQYFRDKDAIVLSVSERYAERFAREMTATAEQIFDAPPRVAVRTLITGALDVLGGNPELVRVLVEQTPRMGGLPTLVAFQQRIADLARIYLAVHRDEVRALDPDTSLWLVVQVGQQLIVRYVLDRPPIPRERFVDEMTELILGYLGVPAS